MTEGTLFVIGIGVMLVIAVAFLIDYRFSGCGLGGAQNGRNNWMPRVLSETIKRITTRRQKSTRQIWDIQ